MYIQEFIRKFEKTSLKYFQPLKHDPSLSIFTELRQGQKINLAISKISFSKSTITSKLDFYQMISCEYYSSNKFKISSMLAKKGQQTLKINGNLSKMAQKVKARTLDTLALKL